MERRVFLVSLVLVVGLGAYLRLADLGGPSLWLDEILHLQVTQTLTGPWYRYLAGVPEIKGGTENGALYYALQALGQWLVPGDTGVRILPAIVGTLTLPLMALTGRELGGRVTALAATFLLAVSPLHVYFSREGRPYYLLMALALVLLYALLRQGSREGVWLAWVGCLLGAYVGVHSVPVLLSFGVLSVAALWWGREEGQRLWRSPYLQCAAAAVLALVLVYGLYMTNPKENVPVLQSSGSQIEGRESPVFESPLSRVSLEKFLASMTTSGHQGVRMSPRSWVLLTMALLGVAVFGRRRAREVAVTVGLFVLPLVLSMAALMAVGRWYAIRYTSSALPAFLLLVALGITAAAELGGAAIGGKSSARRSAAGWATVALLLLSLAAPNLAAARSHPHRKLDWRGVAEFFDAVALEGEPVVVPNDWPRICLDYYLRQRGRSVEFIKIWETAARGDAVVAEWEMGWLLTAGYRKSNEARAWMHRFVPVLKARQEELGLFFFPDLVTLLETRFAAGRGGVFESQFETMGQRFDFGGGETTLQGWGWSYAEQDGDGTGFQWALGEQAELGVPIGRARDATIRLRARPFSYPGAPPQRLQVWLNDAELASLELPEGWSEQQIEVASSSWSGGANILYLRFSRSTRPTRVLEGASDRRPLSAALDYLEIED